MNPIIEQQKPHLVSLCLIFHVKILELFGSAATDKFDAQTSDVDFLVLFQDLSPAEHANAYFGLLAELELMFNRPVDLVEIKAINNPYFLEVVEDTRTLLYAV